jgi:anthranilate phosphoribosyltransferase
MSNAFRELLRKIGSGPHTGENLNRQEAEAATRMMLLQEATPAQIGAFMIAHRIKRPTGEELAGMLDAFEQLGPKLEPIAANRIPVILSSPYDGRSRTAPISPLIALLLAAVGCPVILHGGDRMPTKEGIPLVEIWQELGVDWRHRSLAEVQHVLEETLLGFVYLPTHFPLAQGLVPYREQIGKRPPFATAELIWTPYAGTAHLVAGFVHPPTEGMFQDALQLRGKPTQFTTVKGLEGSCDLPRSRTVIIGLGEMLDHPSVDSSNGSSSASGNLLQFDRLHLHPRDYNLAGSDVPFESTVQTIAAIRSVLNGERSELLLSAIWSGGFYLWRCGICPNMQTGLAQAEEMFISGQVAQKLQKLQSAIEAVSSKWSVVR